MGIINATNLLRFKNSQPFFDEIKSQLKSFDSAGMIDDGSFYKQVDDTLQEIGAGVYKECETFLTIKDGKALLPKNISLYHAAYKVQAGNSSVIKDINEQRPFIIYQDTEIFKECNKSTNCCVECEKDVDQKTRIVVRTFINGTDSVCKLSDPCLLSLSANVRDKCTEDSPSRHCNAEEITIDDGYILTHFEDDAVVWLQYYGIPLNDEGLPMIPDNTHIEKAIKWYILMEFFQEAYWNSTVPNIVNMLADARVQYDKFLAKAKYWANLPSFQKTIEMIRRQRNRNKFWYPINDKTIVNY